MTHSTTLLLVLSDQSHPGWQFTVTDVPAVTEPGSCKFPLVNVLLAMVQLI